MADSDRIIQTVTNLLSNTVKFSPSGSLRGQCRWAARGLEDATPSRSG